MDNSIRGDFLWEGHYRQIIEAIVRGKIVPFLGADINLCDRPETEHGQPAGWQINDPFPPSNQELASYLDGVSADLGPSYHNEIRCPFFDTERIDQLPAGCPLSQEGARLRMAVPNVSTFVSSSDDGDTALYEALRQLFDRQYLPNPIHRFFAGLPSIMRGKNYAPPYPLIVTTCFDSSLERAFREAHEPFDLVSFIGGSQRGHFQHQTPEGNVRDVPEPNTYMELSLEKRPVILKLYGGYSSDTFVITEDHYIDYLAHKDITAVVPTTLLSKLRDNETTLWFLGYSPSLWNLRVILRRLWPEKISVTYKQWWAIQSHPQPLDFRIWKRYSVQIPRRTDIALKDYIAELDNRLRQCPAKIVTATQGQGPHRNQVFISYSHQDRDWLEKLQTMLRPAIRADGGLLIWDDTHIRPGANWRAEIKTALASAKVAVLLVSKEFLDSDFIANSELPPLLEAAEKEGVKILWIYLKDCLYEYSKIADYQATHDLATPLASLSPVEQDRALRKICQVIIDTLKA